MHRRMITGIATATLLASVTVPVTQNLSIITKQPLTQTVKAASSVQSAFLTQAVPAAEKAAYAYGVYPSVMLAQAILESNWGQSTLAMSPNNNLFGIKGSYNGAYVNMPTQEYDSNSQAYYTIYTAFRKYPSFLESFYDNGALLRLGPSFNASYYSGAWIENAANFHDATTNGLQGRYATSPVYNTSLDRLIEVYDLNQYDPTIQTLNQTKTVKQTTGTYNSPAAILDDGIGTAYAGQQVTVSKVITFYNGKQMAKTNVGWIDNQLLSGTSSQSPTNSTNVVSASGVVQINYVPGYGIAVRSTPGGQTTGQYLPHGSNWKYTGYATVNGHKWYRVGTNQWIDSQYTVAPSSSSTTNHQNTSSTTPVQPSYTHETSVVKVTYVSGYGIAVWQTPGGKTTGQYLADGTRWKTFGYTTVNGQKWYNVGSGQWINAQYVDDQESSQAPATSTSTSQTGTVTINYVSGYGIVVWGQPGAKPTTTYLATGTNWKFFKTTTVNGQVWYKLGSNQWVPAQYVKVK